MGARAQGTSGQRSGGSAAQGGGVQSAAATLHKVADQLVPGIAAQVPAGGAAQVSPCTVDAVQVEELAILIQPAPYLVTTEHGTHAFTRVFYQKGEFKLGVDIKRLGGIALRSAHFNTDEGRGLHLNFDRGYEMYIPLEHCQATWKLAE